MVSDFDGDIAEGGGKMITGNNTKNVRSLIENVGKEYENRVFYRFERDDAIFEKGYGTFANDTLAVAGYIDSQNSKMGHKVHAAILGKCTYEYLTVLMGVPCAGGIAIPLDVQLSMDKMVENLKKADVDMLFYDREYISEAEQIHELCPFIKRFVCLQSVKNVRCVPMIHRVFRGTKLTEKINADDCAFIIFTSGTTGQGKGVMLSHGNVIDNMFCTDDETAICLNVLPINHIFCISGDVFLVLRYGSTLCQCDDLSKMFYYIQLFRPTTIRLVPMMAKLFCNRVAATQQKNPDKSILEVKNEVLGERLNKLTSGGGYLSAALSEQLLKLGIRCAQGYGMSECSPKISVPDYERPDKVESVGRIVTGATVRIVDGEIQVKSPSVMLGYYNDPELTKEALTEDGYLCTGDIGYVDDEDFLYLNGRKKNLIILSNGENVSPENIEKLFDGEPLIADIVAYGQEDRIIAEVYPNYEYAQTNAIKDIQLEMDRIVAEHNKQLPTYSQVAECIVRDTPFIKTASKKIKREALFEEKSKKAAKKTTLRKPENELQQKIFELVAIQIGNSDFGIDDNLFTCGLDSMGCTMLISDIAQEMEYNVTLAELMDNGSILQLETLFTKKASESKVVNEIREVYPLTSMMKYFAYVIPGNTTGNLPYAIRLDKSIDIERMKQAIYKVLDAHPSLKAICKPMENKYYGLYRDDNRVIEIPFEKITEAEVKEKMQSLVVPFRYRADDNLVHIYLFESEEYKYLFFDVAHFMGDGMTMNILMEDLNKAYLGQEVEKETYTTFDFIIDENKRLENGVRERDTEYVDSLLKGMRLSGSLLNKAESTNLENGDYGSVRKRFETVARKEVLSYGKTHSVSENAFFVTAFNYCIHLFLGEDDVFCCSIHSGRTDSRWDRIAGPLFETYNCRYTVEAHEKVEDLLVKTGKQIMNTMKCVTSVPREGEMFFQFQGDILSLDEMGGLPCERMSVQLDSLPFHFMVMWDEKGYYTELRYWKNRFDTEIIELFLLCFEAILKAMLSEQSVRCLKQHLPAEVYPHHFYAEAGALKAAAGRDFLPGILEDEPVRAYIFDESYNKKPYGAWGPLYVMNYEPLNATESVQYVYGPGTLYNTGMVARIMPDGTVDFKHEVGRKVLTDGSRGRKYYDLKHIERILEEFEEIGAAECYLKFDKEINEMSLAADVVANAGIFIPGLQEKIREKYGDAFVPKFINVE